MCDHMILAVSIFTTLTWCRRHGRQGVAAGAPRILRELREGGGRGGGGGAQQGQAALPRPVRQAGHLLQTLRTGSITDSIISV